MSVSTVRIALGYRDAGLSIIPTGRKKIPALSEWGIYRRQPADVEMVRRWFAANSNLALVTGAGSGEAEGIDFDRRGAAFGAWRDALPPDLYARLVIEQTPSGGYHVGYRAPQVPGNQKLAMYWDEEEQKPKILIETRGEGGYLMIAPSPGYTLIQGDWAALPTLTAAERAILLDTARSLNEWVRPDQATGHPRSATEQTSGGRRPGDDFDARGDVLGLLGAHGWTIARTAGDKAYLRKPGKSESWQATWNHVPGRFYVWTHSASPFEAERAYSPFAVYTLLECNGDYAAAAAALAKEGYGDPLPPRGPVAPTPAPPSLTVNPQRYMTDSDDPPPTPSTRLIHASLLQTLPPLQWLVPGEIPAGGLTVVFGPSGGGKSFLVLNEYALPIAQRSPVVYVAAEGRSGYALRVRAWCQHHRQNEGHLHFWLDSVAMLDPLAVRAFIDDVARIQPALIILDTLARCMSGGDENSARDMGLFVDACTAIQQGTGATVMVVHHSGKNGANERGSSALRGAADAMIELINEDTTIRVECSKMKDSSPFAPRLLSLLPIREPGASADAEPYSCVTINANQMQAHRGMDLTAQQRKVLDILAMDIFTEVGAKTEQVKKATNIPDGTIFRILNSLKRAEYIRQHQRGDPYFITPFGLSALSPGFSTITDYHHDLGHSNGQLSRLSPTINSTRGLSSLSPPFKGVIVDSPDSSDSRMEESNQDERIIQTAMTEADAGNVSTAIALAMGIKSMHRRAATLNRLGLLAEAADSND